MRAPGSTRLRVACFEPLTVRELTRKAVRSGPRLSSVPSGYSACAAVRKLGALMLGALMAVPFKSAAPFLGPRHCQLRGKLGPAPARVFFFGRKTPAPNRWGGAGADTKVTSPSARNQEVTQRTPCQG
jgi:hypothetical protein